MSHDSRNRRLRARDFAQRARFSPSDVESYGNWQYIRVHPLADESELLSRIGVRPADCFVADAWLYTGNDLLLLEVCSLTAHEPNRLASPGCTAHWWGDPPYMRIHANVAESEITSHVLRTVMAAIARTGVPGRRFCRGRHRKRMRLCNLPSPTAPAR